MPVDFGDEGLGVEDSVEPVVECSLADRELATKPVGFLQLLRIRRKQGAGKKHKGDSYELLPEKDDGAILVGIPDDDHLFKISFKGEENQKPLYKVSMLANAIQVLDRECFEVSRLRQQPGGFPQSAYCSIKEDNGPRTNLELRFDFKAIQANLRSKKNFRLVDTEGKTALLMAKMERDEFLLEVMAPLSPAQGFGTALAFLAVAGKSWFRH